jgi:hypothetical protein
VLLSALVRATSALVAALLAGLAGLIFLTSDKAGSALVVVTVLVVAAAGALVAGMRLARRLERRGREAGDAPVE